MIRVLFLLVLICISGCRNSGSVAVQAEGHGIKLCVIVSTQDYHNRLTN